MYAGNAIVMTEFLLLQYNKLYRGRRYKIIISKVKSKQCESLTSSIVLCEMNAIGKCDPPKTHRITCIFAFI